MGIGSEMGDGISGGMVVMVMVMVMVTCMP